MSKSRLLVTMAIFVVWGSTLAGSAAAAYRYYPPTQDHRSCQEKYRSYLSGGLHRALATTGGRSFCAPNTSYGAAVHHDTVKAAIDDAMYGCRYAGKKNKTPGAC